MEDTVNYLLSEICYGKVENNDTQSKWKAVGKAKPYPGTAVPDDKSLVTFKAFGDKLYGYKSGGTAEDMRTIKAMKKRRKICKAPLQTKITLAKLLDHILIKSWRLWK